MSLCFDIGANTGQWTLQNLFRYNYSKIISVEASPNTYQKLVANSSSQIKEGRILPLPLAVSAKSGIISFYECSHDVLSTTNKSWLTDPSYRFGGSSFKEIKVPTISIDSLIAMYGVPDLIKIDVEGAEHDAITSLTQKVPLLCFEWASEMNADTFRCIDYLKYLGFTKFFIQQQDNYTYRPDASVWMSDSDVKRLLSQTTPKEHWGMIWAC